MKDAKGDPSWRTVFFDMHDAFEWRNEPSEQKMHCIRADGAHR